MCHVCLTVSLTPVVLCTHERQQRERQKAKEQTNATRSVPTAARKYEASSTGEKWMRGGTSIPRSTRTQPARSSTSSSDSSSGSSTSSSKDYQAAKSMAATVEQLASAVALLRSEVAQLQKKSDEQARELVSFFSSSRVKMPLLTGTWAAMSPLGERLYVILGHIFALLRPAPVHADQET